MEQINNIAHSSVTAIIPCYNDGPYVTVALNSMLNQTLLPSRIIIIDDGSSQATKDILEELQHTLLSIMYQDNQGVSAARNNGIRAAKTKYIVTLDADDYFEATFLEKAYQYLEGHKQTGVVGCYYKPFGSKGPIADVIRPKGGTVENFLARNNGLGCSLFRKQCWEEANGYDENFKNGYEDWDFWLTIVSKGWNIHIIPEVLFNYRKKLESRDRVATSRYDYELRVALFEKHRDVYMEKFDSYMYQSLWRNTNLMSQVQNREHSKDFRLGKFLLSPLRKIKSIFIK